MVATCRLVLYHYQHEKHDPKGLYPVRLRVTFQRQSKYYSLRIKCTPKDFNKLMHSSQTREEFVMASHYLNKANDIIRELKDDFNWLDFEGRFFQRKTVDEGPADLLASLEEYAEMVKGQGRIKTFQSLKGTLNRIRLFHKRKRLPIHLVNSDWLNAFAEYLHNDGLKASSIGIHARNIRTIFNWEMSKGRVKMEFYPFGRNKFKPPSASRVKKALTYEEVMRIFDYEPVKPREAWARDMWIFSYLGNGMNIKDLALLRYENIVGSEIHFVRAKTLRKTLENQRLVHVHLHPHMLEIIEKWGKTNPTPESYIFDIMDKGPESPAQETRNVNQAVKTINKHMKRIGEKLQLSKLPTCNFARHTYSTVLKRANVPIEVISEALGHFSVKTTEIYLDSFESEKRAEISKYLLPKRST
jgi:integrase/recombinase XerD